MYEVFDVSNDRRESHGTYDTLGEALGCVDFDRLEAWEIHKNQGFGHVVAFSTDNGMR